MTSRSNVEIRRCRPLLGTFVEITAAGPDESELQASINAAFGAVKKIQSVMSAHDPASELSRLNRAAVRRPVTVSRELFAVLRRADRLAAESDGAFDYTIGSLLARWGYLPRSLRRKRPGNWRQVLLLPGRGVCFLQPLALDLGGIAKGFAVDAAIQVLQRRGAISAIVNAGGDLRVFGAPSCISGIPPLRRSLRGASSFPAAPSRRPRPVSPVSAGTAGPSATLSILAMAPR